ncbi:MAG: hypothetical protein IT435_08230 [Phycisphaerales bacterium]|nr:hypothetical protein [Phycisphaerales bacterium]
MKIRHFLRLLTVTLAVMLLAAPAPADSLKLKDGRTLTGKVTREVDGYIWFKYSVGELEQEKMFGPTDILELKRDDGKSDPAPAPDGDADPATKPDAGTDAAPAPDADAAKPTFPSNVRRIAILTGEEMVGVQMAAKPLEDAIPLLEKDGVTDVVYKVNSGGGYLLEIQKISDVLHQKYKPKFRTVAWIQSAISAAAMSSYCLEEIFFMPNGNFGGCTGWSGQLTAVKGRELEEVLLMMEKISARAQRRPEIMRAMQIRGNRDTLQELLINPPAGELSANIDPRTGEVTWYQDQSGKFVLNPKHGVEILTFDALEAEKFKFSSGTATTHDELARKMGYTEYVFVGKPMKNYAWPVSAAEELQIAWRKGISEAEANFGKTVTSYFAAVQQARSSQDKTTRGSFVNRARTHLNTLRQMAKKYPIFVLIRNLSKDFFDEQEELLRSLMR